MKKLYYITRSYLPSKTGGALMRAGAVGLLSRFYDVTVVTVGSQNEKINGIEVIRIPFNRNAKLMSYAERLGFIEDYLLAWAKSVYDYLSNLVTNDDIIFCTTGGELSTLIVGYWLKIHKGCRYVANFRDPLIYSKVNGLLIDKKFHVSREKSEYKYLSKADLIVTSSISNEVSLKNKYPNLSNRIFNNYFGYIDKCPSLSARCRYPKNVLNIAYGGRFGPLQAPEVFAKAIGNESNVNLYFIGDYKSYKPIWPYTDRFTFIEHLDHAEYQRFLLDNIDIGLLSLSSDYLGACVPAKFYEYINLGIPMLGALPNGDALHLINEKQYGISCYYSDIKGLKDGLHKFIEDDFLYLCKNNIINDRDSWSMEFKIKELVDRINKLS